MKRRPSLILIINTILAIIYFGSCIGLGAAEHNGWTAPWL